MTGKTFTCAYCRWFTCTEWRRCWPLSKPVPSSSPCRASICQPISAPSITAGYANVTNLLGVCSVSEDANLSNENDWRDFCSPLSCLSYRRWCRCWWTTTTGCGRIRWTGCTQFCPAPRSWDTPWPPNSWNELTTINFPCSNVIIRQVGLMNTRLHLIPLQYFQFQVSVWRKRLPLRTWAR